MQDPLAPELALVAALKLTAPPRRWVEEAALIPSTLEGLELLLSNEDFRGAFASDERAALINAGLEPSPPVLGALRGRLIEDEGEP